MAKERSCVKPAKPLIQLPCRPTQPCTAWPSRHRSHFPESSADRARLLELVRSSWRPRKTVTVIARRRIEVKRFRFGVRQLE